MLSKCKNEQTFALLVQGKESCLAWSQAQPMAKCTLTFNLFCRYQSEIRSVKTVQKILFPEDSISHKQPWYHRPDGRRKACVVISLIEGSGRLEFDSFVIQHWFTVFIWPLVGSYTGPVPVRSAWLFKKKKKGVFPKLLKLVLSLCKPPPIEGWWNIRPTGILHCNYIRPLAYGGSAPRCTQPPAALCHMVRLHFSGAFWHDCCRRSNIKSKTVPELHLC